ncbi:ABC transporter ATP-binding protein [Dyella ginsengisoli]|uniref:ABC transporter ATP-binding protein n=1 Tax=Dyella ginsengisoli TaxID=363848 RepID=A0ABW8JSN5_9GAMM
MSSEDTVIRISDVSKRYELYEKPRDRLKQFVLPRLRQLAGLKPRRYFQEFWALRDVSFEVKRGESVGIIGRNGSGKSTLLQIITGTLSPTSGSVYTRGRIAALLELGSGFNPDFSGRENVYLNGALLGFSSEEIDEKFDSIAAFADIGDHLDQPVKTYSSGMLVRLAFAVQVQAEPDILIIDEALAVGDALFQKRCFQRIDQLVSRGTSLLFVSHDQESVRTLTKRAVLLNRGNVVQWGASSDVVLEYRRLLHEEEAAYFGAVAKGLSAKAQEQSLMSVPPVHPAPDSGRLSEVSSSAEDPVPMPERLSFGDGGIRIVRVETLDGDLCPCSAFYPGDKLKIRIVCQSAMESKNLNVAVRLRNKEGVKVYSWGTLNQDMEIRAHHLSDKVFWAESVGINGELEVIFECDCNLGVNLYEVQAAVSYEATPDYMSQRMLHWMDEAAFFQVLMRKDEYFFGGVVDLKMKAEWNIE